MRQSESSIKKSSISHSSGAVEFKGGRAAFGERDFFLCQPESESRRANGIYEKAKTAFAVTNPWAINIDLLMNS